MPVSVSIVAKENIDLRLYFPVLISSQTGYRITQETQTVGSYGGGIHIWDVPVPDRVPFQKVYWTPLTKEQTDTYHR